MLSHCFAFASRAVIALAMLFLASIPVVAAPQFTSVSPGVEVSPAPGDVIDAGQSIVIRLSGDAARESQKSLQVYVDSVDVTAHAVRSGSDVRIAVPAGLNPGLHRVRIVVPSVVGQSRDTSWTFQLPSNPNAELRDSVVTVSSNAKRTLYESDTLEISANGPPGGKAVADIGGRLTLPLTETSPGQYTARHDITRSDYFAAPVRVRITLPDGRTVGNMSDNVVKAFGRMFTVRIDSPVNGSKVPYNFVIVGRTRPNARVSISPRFGATVSPAQQSASASVRPSTISTVKTGMGGWDIQADEHGRFEQKFGFPIQGINISYSFILTATDPQGEQAIPSTFFVTLTKKPDGTPEKKEETPSPTPAPAPQQPDPQP